MGCCCCSSKSDEEEKNRDPLQRDSVCCTDILFLIVFVAFVGGMVFVSAFAIANGDAYRLVYGYDSYGNTCNKPNNDKIENLTFSGRDTTGNPYVFFMSHHDPLNSMQVCVKKCPEIELTNKQAVYDFSKNTGSKLCRYDLDLEDYKKESTIFGKTGPCPELPVGKSIALFFRCVPDPAVLISEKIFNITSGMAQLLDLDGIYQKVLADVYLSWKQILAMCGLSLVVSYLMVILLRCIAKPMVIIILIVAAVGSIVGTAFLWWAYFDARNHSDTKASMRIPVLDVDIQNQTAFFAFSIIASVLTVILLLILLVMRSRIMLAAALFKEGGRCLQNVPLLLLQPVVTFVILVVFLAYWLIIMGYITTAGVPTGTYNLGFEHVKYEQHELLRACWWYHVVALIWISEFIVACQQFIIGGTVATWYFNRGKPPMGVICNMMCRLIFHHLGSVAFGSFIILCVKLPRYILMYIKAKYSNQESQLAKFCLKCCICCLWCLEKCLKFLNQNAYVIIAIEGKSFCPAAKKAFGIIVENVLRVLAINSVGTFVLFLGEIGVMAVCGAISVFWLKDMPGLHFYVLPVAFVCLFSFFVAHCTLSIYQMVVDALLLCFCEDCKMNDGHDKPYYMNDSLMDYVDGSSNTLNRLKTKPKKSDAPAESVPLDDKK